MGPADGVIDAVASDHPQRARARCACRSPARSRNSPGPIDFRHAVTGRCSDGTGIPAGSRHFQYRICFSGIGNAHPARHAMLPSLREDGEAMRRRVEQASGTGGNGRERAGTDRGIERGSCAAGPKVVCARSRGRARSSRQSRSATPRDGATNSETARNRHAERRAASRESPGRAARGACLANRTIAIPEAINPC